MKEGRRKDHFDETQQPRKSVSDSWLPEKNATTGFTIKGMVMLLFLVGLFAIIKYLFF